jgi:hypothetical protein
LKPLDRSLSLKPEVQTLEERLHFSALRRAQQQIAAFDYEQIPQSPRRNGLPVKRLNGTLLMGHKYLAGAFVKLHQVAKAASCPNRALHHPPEAFDGVEMVPTMGG